MDIDALLEDLKTIDAEGDSRHHHHNPVHVNKAAGGMDTYHTNSNSRGSNSNSNSSSSLSQNNNNCIGNVAISNSTSIDNNNNNMNSSSYQRVSYKENADSNTNDGGSASFSSVNGAKFAPRPPEKERSPTQTAASNPKTRFAVLPSTLPRNHRSSHDLTDSSNSYSGSGSNSNNSHMYGQNESSHELNHNRNHNLNHHQISSTSDVQSVSSPNSPGSDYCGLNFDNDDTNNLDHHLSHDSRYEQHGRDNKLVSKVGLSTLPTLKPDDNDIDSLLSSINEMSPFRKPTDFASRTNSNSCGDANRSKIINSNKLPPSELPIPHQPSGAGADPPPSHSHSSGHHAFHSNSNSSSNSNFHTAIPVSSIVDDFDSPRHSSRGSPVSASPFSSPEKDKSFPDKDASPPNSHSQGHHNNLRASYSHETQQLQASSILPGLSSTHNQQSQSQSFPSLLGSSPRPGSSGDYHGGSNNIYNNNNNSNNSRCSSGSHFSNSEIVEELHGKNFSLTNAKNKCLKIILGGSSSQRGVRLSSFSKCVCDHLRCLQCNFEIRCFKNSRWGDKMDYLFFRNSMSSGQENRALVSGLVREADGCAYCCQCSWASVVAEVPLQGASSDSLPAVYNSSQNIQWICAGHVG